MFIDYVKDRFTWLYRSIWESPNYLMMIGFLPVSVIYPIFRGDIFTIFVILAVIFLFLTIFNKRFFYLVICLLLCCIRIYLDYVSTPIDVNLLGDVELTGFVYSDPEFKHEKMNIYFRSKGNNYFFSSNRNFAIEYGSNCKVNGNISLPKNTEDFDFKAYLWSKHVNYVIENPLIVCSGKENSTKFLSTILLVKKWVVSKIERMMHEPHSSLLIGILIGADRVFDNKFQESLRIAGTSHIIAASGYNVTIIYLSINRLLFFINSKVRSIIAIFFIFCFCFLAGLSASIVRATLMVGTILLTKLLGLNIPVSYIFFFSVTLFVLINPRIWLDIGFQLSVAATFGLIFLNSSITGFFNIKSKFLLETFLPTLSCTIITLPIIISNFEIFSVVSIIANMLILPVVQSSLLLGLLSLFIPIFIPIVWLQLEYFVFIVELLGGLQYVSYEISMSPLVSIGIYLILFLFIILSYPVDGKNSYLSV